MSGLLLRFRNWCCYGDGQGMVEYALIVGLISVLLVVGLSSTRIAYSGVFSKLDSSLAIVPSSSPIPGIPPPPPGWTWWQWFLWWIFHH